MILFTSSSQQQDGGVTSKPTATLQNHVHIDQPTSAQSILQACRQCGNEKCTEDALQSYLVDLQLVSTTDASIARSIAPCAAWKEALHIAQGESDAVVFPLSVREIAAQALTYWSEMLNDDDDNDVNVPYSIVASVWWICHCFQARSVTCSPIPCTVATALRWSLHGLPIQISTEANNFPTADGVAICRALCCSDTTPPRMVLLHAGSSSTDGSSTTMVAVGTTTTIPDADDTHSNSSNSTATDLSCLERPYWNVHRDLSLLSTNIDDMTGEQLAFCAEHVLLEQQQCLDVWITPIVMKKGRPAHTLHCLVPNALVQPVLVALFEQTTTLGVRVHNTARGLTRVALRRTQVTVRVCGDHSVRCKVGYMGDDQQDIDGGSFVVCSVKPEFEDCKRAALENGMGLEQVSYEALSKAKRLLAKQQRSLNHQKDGVEV